MLCEVKGKVLGVREIERKSGDKAFVVELYQAGEREVVRVVTSQVPKFKEGEEVLLKCIVKRSQFGYVAYLRS